MTTRKPIPIRLRHLAASALSLTLLIFGPSSVCAQAGTAPPGKAETQWNPATGVPALVHAGFQQGVSTLGQVEFVQMLGAIVDGSMMGPGDGWFHPSRSKYGWVWLAYHFDKNRDGKITPAEFNGPAATFKALDRNGDGVLSAEDVNWWAKPGGAKPGAGPNPAMIFALMDGDGNGKISQQEWLGAFKYLSAGKDHLTPADLGKMFGGPSSPPKGSSSPMKEILLKGLFTGEVGSPFEGPQVGDFAPDFTLKTQDGKQSYTLAQYREKKPVVLVFGSFT